jgi:hypothetical protein
MTECRGPGVRVEQWIYWIPASDAGNVVDPMLHSTDTPPSWCQKSVRSSVTQYRPHLDTYMGRYTTRVDARKVFDPLLHSVDPISRHYLVGGGYLQIGPKDLF